ncbi:chromosome segregation protein SMC [Bacillus tuaregi]|uniref:chromosome segregation protein SMC n=1 Tax=Bacillus tuaregi TaxID=1816695 RepID=UPI0008F81DBF|nr:chromosome segregation protein SMC [Bacillus tuaregi]
MFLKRLDIVGFKSFAERIAVDFVQGVTAVVGPNGSGKSNITDAIRWVLGEQSAKSLRGAKMEDIIFAGSDSRKPLNFAEVTLTLDNEDQFLPVDYNEVSVTRRVFRSGDSEFFINKQACRLKDIVDLFMDSGLGREAFSIISQGKVEEILNSKAEDRRTIFEEAAGVLKYKTRKKKAEGKLHETEENLNRVNDILYELESQIEPLKIQSSMAKDYLEQKEALEKVEVAVTVFEIEELYAKWKSMSEKVEEFKQNEIKLSTLLQGKEAKLEELRDQIAAMDESISQLQNVLLHASEELEKLEGRKEVLKERKKNAAQNKTQLENNVTELTNKVLSLTSQKATLEKHAIQLEKEASLIKAQLKEKQTQINLLNENIDQIIDDRKSEYIEILNTQAATKNELNLIEQQLKQVSERSKRQEGDNAKYITEREALQKQIVHIKQTLSAVQQQIEAQVHLYRNQHKEFESLKSTYEKNEKMLYQAYQYLQQTKSRKEMLQEMEEGFAGFFQGVKEVLKAREGNLQGIEGAVAELISVPKEYEVAIETALGTSMQHIVVKDEQAGRQAIQFLKNNRFGRATFLPLTVIKGKALAENQLRLMANHPDFVGVAAELISYDSMYADVIKNLLGMVVITKDLKGANEMAKLLGYRCRFVTLDGDLVNAGGSMTGGALKQNSASLLSRKSELDELKEKLADMETKTAHMEVKIKKLKKDVANKEVELEGLRKQGESLRLEEQAIKGELREAELQEKNMNERLSLYDLNKQEFMTEEERITARRKSLKALLEKLQTDIQELETNINQLSEQKNSQTTSKDTLLSEISELKAVYAAKSEQVNHAKEKFSAASMELEDSEKKLRFYQEDLQLLDSEMSESSSGESKLKEAALEKLRDKNETVELIAKRREERLSMQNVLDDLDLEIKELKRQHRGVTVFMKDEEVQLNRLDVELENKLAHLREEYLLSFEGAKEAYPLTLPIEEARTKVKLIKLALEELGTVNLGAIEEYERVSERYEFLIEQRNDLDEAKNTLFQVIDEMDEEMKRRFEQTFEGVRFHFESVFKELFGGGRADLRLTNPEDLLNTGVDIVAQPPGKKLQNLGLLSGGERALTAIALLFSILKIRPVPFCILDEVEAALDEANVYRFSQYLKRYSKESQFIVITHRKGTMEEADVLYGITMQESGVSKLVSVRLEETGEFAAQ